MSDDFMIHRDDLADWFRRTLVDLEGRPGGEIHESWAGEHDEPLTVDEVRQRCRSGLARIQIEKHLGR